MGWEVCTAPNRSVLLLFATEKEHSRNYEDLWIFPNYNDSFCYICGSLTIPSQSKHQYNYIIKQVYFAYFKVKLGDEDKPSVPHRVCKHCVECLWMWTRETYEMLAFDIPMVW